MRRIFALGLALAACGGSTRAARHGGAGPGAVWSYEAALADSGQLLHVRATFGPGAIDDGTAISVTEGAEPFVRGMASSAGAVSRHDGDWRVAGCEAGCTIEYDFALAEASRSLRDDEIASGTADAPQATPGAWLLRPLAARDSDRFRLVVRTPPGLLFATGMRAEDTAGTTFSGPANALRRTPYSLFGRLRRSVVPIDERKVTLAVTATPRSVDDAALIAWVERSARAVTSIFGRFPIDGAMVGVVPRGGSEVGFGRALSGPYGGSILVDLGRSATEADLRDDWVLVHEMIHLGFPSLERRHRWMEEGLATYLEPIARARAGLVSETAVWTGFAMMMPNGLPMSGDHGLDRTPTWGRIYWGGALFFLVTDVEIRTRTHGKKSLDDAVRAILAAGGNNGQVWPVERALAVGDEATGVAVLLPTYRAWKDAPVDVDLDALFRKLGVRLRGEVAELDAAAPLAHLRAPMTARVR